MQSHISQYGNSLAIRIPKPFAKELGLAKGSTIDLRIKDGKLVVEVLNKHDNITGTPPDKLLKFVERLPRESMDEIDNIIEEGCEQINEAEW